MRYIVFGAGGFIGSFLTKRLKELNHYVIGVDRHLPRYMSTYTDEFYICNDIGNEINIPQSSCINIDGVFQLSAFLGGSRLIDSGSLDCDIFINNIKINISVINFCKVNNIKRIFFTSSVCVYGTNNMTINPVNIYGWEKIASEKMYTACARQYNIDVKIGRLYNIYGPLQEFTGGRERVMAALSYKMCTNKGSTMLLTGNSYDERSFLHVEDCVNAIIVLFNSDIQEPVDIGSNNTYSIYDIAKYIIGHSKRSIDIIHTGDHLTKTVRACNTQIIQSLGWSETVDIVEGTRQVYDFVSMQLNS